MDRLSDRAMNIINELHTERLDYNSEYLPLIDAVQHLSRYEDLEEQRRIVILPCKIDAPIYLIHQEEKKPRKPPSYRVEEYHIDHFTIGEAMIPMITACGRENEWEELIDGTQQGQEYFLSREAAERAMRGENFAETVDIVCMDCAFGEETCENCPVRKTVDIMKARTEEGDNETDW